MPINKKRSESSKRRNNGFGISVSEDLYRQHQVRRRAQEIKINSRFYHISLDDNGIVVTPLFLHQIFHTDGGKFVVFASRRQRSRSIDSNLRPSTDYTEAYYFENFLKDLDETKDHNWISCRSLENEGFWFVVSNPWYVTPVEIRWLIGVTENERLSLISKQRLLASFHPSIRKHHMVTKWCNFWMNPKNHKFFGINQSK